jgi:hypothetical protein
MAEAADHCLQPIAAADYFSESILKADVMIMVSALEYSLPTTNVHYFMKSFCSNIALIFSLALSILPILPARCDNDHSHKSGTKSVNSSLAVSFGHAVVGTVTRNSTNVKSALHANDIAKASAMTGKSISICGTVASIYSPPSHSLVFVDFSKDYKSDISVVAMSSAFAKLPDLNKLTGKEVLISGIVKSYHDKPEIMLESANQIRLVH